jgi:hypothetical protein
MQVNQQHKPEEQKMSQFTNALERINMPVSDERDADGKRVLVDYTGHTVARVSDRYALVQNRDIFGPIVAHFGEDKIKRVMVQGRGRYAHMMLETGREFSFSYNGQTDVIKERLVIENSYNHTRSFRFMFGAFRMVCSNGLYTGQAVLAIRRIHSGRIDIGGIVQNVLDSWETNSFDLWRDFQRQPMTLQEEIALAERFQPFDGGTDEKPNLLARRSNRWVSQCAVSAVNRPESVDNQRNAWGLLNGLNRGISTVLRTRGALQRVISANQAAEAHVLQAVRVSPVV